MGTRYFLGIHLPKGAADRLWMLQTEAQEKLTKQGVDVKISQGLAPLHLTLVSPFEIETTKGIDQVERGLALIGNVQPLTFSLVGLDHFDDEVVYAKIGDHCLEELRALHNAALYYLGRDNHRHFTPHVSLARQFKTKYYEQVWDAFQASKVPAFPMEIQVPAVTLYERKANEWVVHTTMPLARSLVA